MNIFTKYSIFMMGMLLLAVGSVTALALQLQKNSLTREAILRGQSIAVNLALSSGDDLLSKLYFRLVPLALRAKEDNDLAYAAVVNQDNLVVAHPEPERLNKPFQLDSVSPVSDNPAKANVVRGEFGGEPVWNISVPIKPRGASRAIGLVHVGMSIAKVEESVRRSRNELLRTAAGLCLLGLGLTLAAVFFLVRPLKEISQAAAQVGSGDLEVTVPVRSGDEMGRLAGNFNAMVGNLKNAEQAKLEKERIQSELNLARNIQAGLLPKEPPSRGDVDMAFYCMPAKELGGDFYDWFEVRGSDKLAFVIADVSGKGVPAALHMTNLRNLFRFVAESEPSPGEVLKKVNRLAYPDLRGESFVTLIYAVYDPAKSEIRMANAGHDPAYLRRSRDGQIHAFDSTALPIGLVDGEDYDEEVEERTVSVAGGDLFLIFTDGVTEAMNESDEQFGLERLQEAMEGVRDAKGAVESVVSSVDAHAAGFEQSDDLTLMAFVPKSGSAAQGKPGNGKMMFSGNFDYEELDRLHDTVAAHLKDLAVDSADAYSVITVVDELSANMMEHSKASWIEIEIQPKADLLRLVMRDDGGAFDPTAASQGKDYEAYLETGTERKLGLYMVNQLTRGLNYRRLDSGINEVVFEVTLSSRGTT